MTPLHQQLAQYGAIGALLATFVALFLWSFRALFQRFLAHLDFMQVAFKEIVDSVKGLNAKLEDNHREVMHQMENRAERRRKSAQ